MHVGGLAAIAVTPNAAVNAFTRSTPRDTPSTSLASASSM
jgi:hypothetical protein